MRKRLAVVGLSVILGANGLSAQPPQFPVAPPAFPPSQPRFPTAPAFPGQPMSTPPQLFPIAPPAQPPASTQPQFPVAPAIPAPPVPGQPRQLPPAMLPPLSGARPVSASGSLSGETPLPHAEQKMPIRAMDVQVKRVIGGWQVWAGQKMLRDLGENEINARDMVRVLRDLRPTEWVTIGGAAKPVVEYGLINGRSAVAAAAPDGKREAKASGELTTASFNGPLVTGAGAKVVHPIDLRSARAEPVRGVWCVRDDNNILLNFGTDKTGAEQAIAVIRKYGFNRVGVVGEPTQPAMSYLFTSLDSNPPKAVGGQLLLNAQIDALTRTGIPIPGVGFAGEMVKIDSQKVEARKQGTEWVVMAGSEVLGHFGPTEWAACDAARTIRNARFTEFCKLGGKSDLTFFLTDGKPPTRAPFNAQGRNFDRNSLRVQRINDRWAVTESGKHLFDVNSQQEGDVVIRVLRAYGFSQMARLTSGGPKGGIMFLVKNR